MSERIRWAAAAPDAYKALLSVHHYLEHCGVDPNLLNLVYLRASMINGCAFCIDMHWKDLRVAGVSEQHLYMLGAWREWPHYSERERAALAWTDAVTTLSDQQVPDDVYAEARSQFDDADLSNLTLAICAINSWNRMNVAFRRAAGGYQPPTAQRV